MEIYYNSLDKRCKSVIGALRQNDKLNINVFATEVNSLKLYLRRDDCQKALVLPMKKEDGGFFVQLEQLQVGLYWYIFEADGVIFGRNRELKAEINSLELFQLIVYENDFTTPNWIKGGVIYQIFPDRFLKSGDFSVKNGKVARHDWGGQPTFRNENGEVLNNEFFGGSFEGIRQRLGFLKELNVSCVYLNPICEAYSSHRYDTGDYLAIDSVLGSEKDLKRLIKEGEQLGIRFVFDGVYNHTGADSRYFNKYNNYDSVGAYQGEASPYYNWYCFNEAGYDCWWNFKNLPSIDKNSESFQAFITDKVLPFNIELGFSGVRLDVVDELTDEFVKKIRKKIKSLNKNSFIIGEVWENATNKVAYGVRRAYFLGSELDSVMNYPIKDAIISYLLQGDCRELCDVIRLQIDNYPKCALDTLMNLLSSHDTPRIITVLGRNKIITDKDEMKYETLSEAEYQKGKKLAKIAYALLFTVYGVPSVYYGDEAGLFGNLDPYNRLCYPWDNIDEDMLSHIKKLSLIRKDNAVFAEGELNILSSEKNILVFERSDLNEKIIIAAARGGLGAKLSFNYTVTELLSDRKNDCFYLEPDSVAIFKKCK